MRIPRIGNKGTALVEFALIALLLLTLAIGIIDFGLLAKDHMTLSSAVREGATAAARLGADLDSVRTTVTASAPTPKEGLKSVTLEYRDGPEGTWQATDILDSSKVQVKVEATYECHRISGSFLGVDPITLSSKEVMHRE